MHRVQLSVKRILPLGCILIMGLLISCNNSILMKGTDHSLDNRILTWGNDHTRSGWCAQGPQPPFKPKWTLKTTGAIDKAINARGSYIYFGTNYGWIEVVDIFTGEYKKKIKILKKKTVTCLIDTAFLYVFKRYGHKTIVAYDLYTGKTEWEFEAGEIEGEPLLYKGNIFLFNSMNVFYVIDKKRGTCVFQKKFRHGITGSLARDKNFFYFCSGKGKVISIYLKQGKIHWIRDLNEEIFATPVVSSGKVFVGTIEGSFFCLSAENGSVLWKFSAEGSIYHKAAASHQIVTFGTTQGIQYGLDHKGKFKWKLSTNSVIGSSPLICHNEIYFGTLDKRIIAVNTETGNKVWQYKTKGRVRTVPIIYNNMLIAASDDRFIYGFEPLKEYED